MKGVRRNHSVRDRGVHTAPFYVLIGADMPAVLAEIAFVSNPETEARLRTASYRDLLARSLFGGVKSYLEALSRTQTTPIDPVEPALYSGRWEAVPLRMLLLQDPAITWIKVEKPTFDLVGLVLGSFKLAGFMVVAALLVGILIGAVLVLARRRATPAPPLDDVSLHLDR